MNKLFFFWCIDKGYHLCLKKQDKQKITTLCKVLHVCSLVKSCATVCDPIGSTPPGSSAHGIYRQAYWSG